jgi:hypothetical protein
VVRAVVGPAAGVAGGVVRAAGVVTRVVVTRVVVTRVVMAHVVGRMADVAGGVVGAMTGLGDARHGEHGDGGEGEKRLAHWRRSFLGIGGRWLLRPERCALAGPALKWTFVG